MVGALQYRLGARQRGVRLDELGRGVDRAADLARVPILVLRVTVRALALDVAIREEHPLHRIVELLNGLRVHETRRAQAAVDILRERDVLRRVRGIPVVELDVKPAQVLWTSG